MSNLLEPVDVSRGTLVTWNIEIGALIKIAAHFNCAGGQTPKNKGKGREVLAKGYRIYADEVVDGESETIEIYATHMVRGGVDGVEIQKIYKPYSANQSYKKVVWSSLEMLKNSSFSFECVEVE
jgi:hypothetical protein